MLAAVPGATDVQMETEPGTPEVTVRLRPERLFAFGFQPAEVLETIETAYQGAVVAQSYQGNRVVDVNVILTERDRRAPGALRPQCLRLDRLRQRARGTARGADQGDRRRDLSALTRKRSR